MRIDVSDITRNLAADLMLTERVVERVSDRVADVVEQVCISMTPVRTGYMKGRWQQNKEGKWIRVVENDAPYAGHVNDGTSKQGGVHMVETAIQAAARK